MKYYLTLDNEFIQFCQLNGIDDIEGYANKLFNEKFTSIKYPTNPLINIKPTATNKIKKTNLYGE